MLLLVVKGRYQYFPCRNIDEFPERDFYLSPDDYYSASQYGEAIIVFHSHPSTAAIASDKDKEFQADSELKWIIYSVLEDKWCECDNNIKSELYGRQYLPGSLDCYSFVRDWYSQELGIQLSNFHRNNDWWKKGLNMYVDNYPSEGFYKIDMASVKYGDLILITIDSPVPNHGAIYVGNNCVGHHLANRLSSKDVYGRFLRDRSTLFLRHKDNDKNS